MANAGATVGQAESRRVSARVSFLALSPGACGAGTDPAIGRLEEGDTA